MKNCFYLCFFCLHLLFYSTLEAQNGEIRAIALATTQIKQLKGGVLLIRLHSKKNLTDTLRKKGMPEQAEEIEKKQSYYNLEIIHAFRESFNFCPVYFFYSEYSEAVKKKQFDKVIFLNEKLRQDTSIKFNAQQFFCAEFGTISNDTSRSSVTHYETDSGKQPEAHTKQYEGADGPTTGITGIIIESDQFIQLRKPFPFYKRTYTSVFGKRIIKNAVAGMNENLLAFYNYATGHKK